MLTLLLIVLLIAGLRMPAGELTGIFAFFILCDLASFFGVKKYRGKKKFGDITRNDK